MGPVQGLAAEAQLMPFLDRLPCNHGHCPASWAGGWAWKPGGHALQPPGLENGSWPRRTAASDHLMTASLPAYPQAERLTYRDLLPFLSSIEDGSPHSRLSCH